MSNLGIFQTRSGNSQSTFVGPSGGGESRRDSGERTYKEGVIRGNQKNGGKRGRLDTNDEFQDLTDLNLNHQVRGRTRQCEKISCDCRDN